MIYGNIDELKFYKGISKYLDEAIDYIILGRYKEYKLGKNIINGEKVFFNFDEGTITRNIANPDFEYHRKYIDIHLILEGEENIVYGSSENSTEITPYSTEKDVGFLKSKTELKFYMNKGRFLIVFPHEAHMALISVKEPKLIKKLVFKIEY